MTVTTIGWARRIGCAAVATTALVAIGGSATPGPPSAPPPLAWQECGPGFDCARLPVPLDHARPDGETIELALVRHRATDPQRRIGSLLVNPGGPGAGAADMVRAIGTPGDMFGAEVMARYDVVGMDPRGTGASSGVECLTDAQREENIALDLDPALPGGLPRDQLTAEVRELTAGCADRVEPELLESVSTVEVARDMDLVRVALTEDRISYLGLSYGTLLGATYATLFPQHVRHMVLDAPVDADVWRSDPLHANVEQARSAEAVLDKYFATCQAEGDACPFGAGRPAEAFDALVARLEAQPLQVPPVGPRPGGRVDGAALLIAARTAVFDRRFWPLLTAGLIAAEQGDGSLLHTLSGVLQRNPDGTPSSLGEANPAVNCLDRDVPSDLAAHDRNVTELAEAAPRFGVISGYVLLACATWPAENPDRHLGPLDGAGAPPILVVGGREDSQTPYPWAEAMAGKLESGVLLTRDGVGHGSYGNSGPCVDDAVDRYLTTGALPAEGTVCPQEPPATASPAGGGTG